MKTLTICLALTGLAFMPTLARTQDCALSDAAMTTMTALDYDAFNYGAEGWRKLSSQGCYKGAGSLIISWLIDHESTLNPAELRTQHYQAARNFALANRKDVALLQLRMALTKANVVQGAMDWNSYLEAFGSWLSSDKHALDAAVMRLEKQKPGVDGRRPNLDAARRFQRCFAKSYLAIEQDLACLAPRPTGATP